MFSEKPPKTKLPKLTKKQKREEKKRKQEQKRRFNAHSHVEREIKYGELTRKRCERKWRRLLLSISIPRCQEEILYAWHNFERIVDSKDFVISLLMDELNDAEDQYMTNIRQHISNIDKLIDVFKDRLAELNYDFKKSIDDYIEEGKEISEKIRAKYAEDELHFKTILFALEKQRESYEQEVKGEFAVKLQDMNNAFKIDIFDMWNKRDQYFTNLFNETKHALNDFYKSTQQKKTEHDALFSQDTVMADIQRQQLEKIIKMYFTIQRLKEKYLKLKEKNSKNLALLLRRKMYFLKYYEMFDAVLKRTMRFFKNLTITFVCNTNETLNIMEKVLKKMTIILKLVTECRKLETQGEKILCFPLNNPCKIRDEKYITTRKLNCNFDYSSTKIFWKKVALADAVRLELIEERNKLRRENTFLKNQIFNYCHCLNCPAYSDTANKDLINEERTTQEERIETEIKEIAFSQSAGLIIRNSRKSGFDF